MNGSSPLGRALTFIATNISTVFSVCLLLAAGLFLGLKFATSDGLYFQLFSDRDFWRGADAMVTFPHLGSEHGGPGHRVPGGFFYYFLWLWLQISPQVDFVNVVLVALFGGSAVLLAVMVRRYYGWPAAVISLAFYLSAGMFADVIIPWNPGFLPIFVVAAYFLYFRVVVDGHAASFPPLMLVISLASQFHSQIGILLLLFLAGIAVRRVRLGWVYGILGLVFLLLPLAHHIYVEATTGGVNTMLVVKSYEGRPLMASSLISFDYIADVLYIAAWGLWAIFANGVDMVAPPFRDTFPAIWAAIIASDFLIAAVVLGFAGSYLLRPYSERCRAFWQGDTMFGNMAWMVICYCLLYALSRRGIFSKHMVAAVPAAAVIVGVSISRVITWLTANRAWGPGMIAALVCMAVFGVRVTAPSVLLATQPDLPINQQHADLAGHLKSKFYPDREAFENSTFAFTNLTDPRLQEDYGRISYFHRTSEVTAAAAPSDACTIVVKKLERGGAPLAERLKGVFDHPKVARLGPRDLHRTESRHSVYLHYRTASGNCLKSFVNAYIPTRLERHLQPHTASLPAAPGSVIPVAEGTTRWFIVRVRENSPVVVLEFGEENGRTLVTMRGNGLRGPTGLSLAAGSLSIRQPTLQFTEVASGRVRSVTLFDGVVGSFDIGTLAPWRSMPFDLPAGRYSVRFQGAEVNRRGDQLGAPWDIVLSESFPKSN